MEARSWSKSSTETTVEGAGKLLAGEIGKPHGISGEVYVIPISDDPRRFEPGSRLLHADGRSLTVQSARPHRNRFLVKFEGIDTRTDAETLRGALFVRSEDLRDLAEGEYWPHDLIGCRVVQSDGDEVGEVMDVVPGPAHDFLAVRTERGDRLVPLVGDIVVNVDLAARRIRVDPPAGLLEP
jgi:16S rRNA processing protein RimM